MLDDDIVYLGTRIKDSTPPARSPQRPVTGIALHIEKSGGIEAYGMLFRRTNTSVVHIGRRSGLDSERRSEDAELGNAMFRCAVVSRKHAKIAFSDSGLAYLIDLGSHHGTHIRKPGERFSRPLKPESPTLLADGDIVTFGKSVGKNEECVRPVVARIELLYSGHNSTHSTTPIKPLVVPCNSSPSSDKSSLKSNSGRYGINDSSSSSSDESSFNSGLYSDIEEISAPPTSCSKPVTPQSSSNSTGSFLKRLLPPSHSPGVPRRDFLPSLSEIVERPLAHVSMFFSSFGPESVPTSPNGYNFSPLAPIPDLERSVSPLPFAGSEFLPIGFDASQHDIYDISDHVPAKLRSPMELASPSPPPELIPPASNEWSPLITSPTATKQLKVLNPASGDPTSSGSSENNAMASENFVVEGGGASSPLPSDAIPPSSDVQIRDSAPTSAQMTKFEELLEKLQFDVSKLHNHRRKYKARFNSNVEVISGKLAQFDDRLAEVNAEYTMLFDQVDTIHHVDIPDLQTQLEALQERVDDLPDPFSTPDPRECTPQHEREVVKANIQALKSLVDEMRTLRETSHVQMAAELEALKVMRETAMANITETQAQASQTSVLLSLKRKRDDPDENEEVDENENIQESVDAEGSVDLANQDKDVVMDDVVCVPSTKPEVLAAAAGTHHRLDASPPRKRARQIASVLAHTATAVTIGAVVTWSALAFS